MSFFCTEKKEPVVVTRCPEQLLCNQGSCQSTKKAAAVVPDTDGYSVYTATKAAGSIGEFVGDGSTAGKQSETELAQFITMALSKFRNNFYYSHFLKYLLCQVEPM